MSAEELGRLGLKYGSTKIQYTAYFEAYARAFHELRGKEEARVLEIGIDRGGSHRMWAEYMPNATIFGIDPFHLPESVFPRGGQPDDIREQLEAEGVRTFEGNQLDRRDLQKFIDRHGTGFDVIIDDAAHMPDAIQISLGYLFPHLKSGGSYFVEDLMCAADRQNRIAEVNKKIKGLLKIPHVVDYHLSESVNALQKSRAWLSTVLTPDEKDYLVENIATCQFLANSNLCQIVKK